MTLTARFGAVRRELRVPLYRNAYALMLNTVVNSGLGLVYWVLAARTYPDAEVGRGNALISLMMLLSVVAQLNFGAALIRFLPRAGTASRGLLFAAYGTAAALSALVAGVAVLWCHLALTASDPLHMSWAFGAWFVVSTVAWSVFALQDAALTGLRSTLWVPLENGLYGLFKLVLLVVFAAGSVAYGVFSSWTLPVLVLLLPVTWLILGRLLPRHVRESGESEQVPERRTVARYIAGDYAGQLLTQASTSLLPVLVVAQLGVEQAAYILPAQTIFTALNLLALGITSSLVVEGARDEAHAHTFAVAVLRRIAITVVPAAIVITVTAPWLLELFGPRYRTGATTVLQLLMLSTLPRIVSVLYTTRCRLQNRTGRVALLQGGQSALLVGGTVALAPTLGLSAVGWAALVSQLVPAVVLAPTVVHWLFPRSPRDVAIEDATPPARSSPR